MKWPVSEYMWDIGSFLQVTVWFSLPLMLVLGEATALLWAQRHLYTDVVSSQITTLKISMRLSQLPCVPLLGCGGSDALAVNQTHVLRVIRALHHHREHIDITFPWLAMAHAALPGDQVQLPAPPSGSSQLLMTPALGGLDASCFHRYCIHVHTSPKTRIHISEKKTNL